MLIALERRGRGPGCIVHWMQSDSALSWQHGAQKVPARKQCDTHLFYHHPGRHTPPDEIHQRCCQDAETSMLLFLVLCLSRFVWWSTEPGRVEVHNMEEFYMAGHADIDEVEYLR